jgi:hypothetical protein
MSEGFDRIKAQLIDSWLERKLSDLLMSEEEWASFERARVAREREEGKAREEREAHEKREEEEMTRRMQQVTVHLLLVRSIRESKSASLAQMLSLGYGPNSPGGLYQRTVTAYDTGLSRANHEWEGSCCRLCGYMRADMDTIEETDR